MPKVNQKIKRASITFTANGIVKPKVFFNTSFTGGKNNKDKSKPIIPGTACTKTRFSIPIVKTARPNTQLMIFCMDSFCCIIYFNLIN